MPTKRFSTRSTRPMPCLPPSLFSVCITPSGESFLPFTATQFPSRNRARRIPASSGASSGATLSLYIPRASSELASNQGSSSMPLSKLMWRRLRSIEYGLAALASTGNLLRRGVSDHLGAAGKLFAKTLFAPRRDDAQLRRQRRRGQLEADLIVPLAGRAMRNRIRLFGARDLDHALRDERPRDAGSRENIGLRKSRPPASSER